MHQSTVLAGTQKNCEAARDRILKIQAEQANIVTDTIDIDPKFHNAIIGSKGKVLKDIVQQCGGVAVNFPKEKGSSKVSIRGDREDVEKAKKNLLELANEKVRQTVTAGPLLSSALGAEQLHAGGRSQEGVPPLHHRPKGRVCQQDQGRHGRAPDLPCGPR